MLADDAEDIDPCTFWNRDDEESRGASICWERRWYRSLRPPATVLSSRLISVGGDDALLLRLARYASMYFDDDPDGLLSPRFKLLKFSSSIVRSVSPNMPCSPPSKAIRVSSLAPSPSLLPKRANWALSLELCSKGGLRKMLLLGEAAVEGVSLDHRALNGSVGESFRSGRERGLRCPLWRRKSTGLVIGELSCEGAGRPDAFGPPILDRRCLSYACDEYSRDFCSSCLSLCNLWPIILGQHALSRHSRVLRKREKLFRSSTLTGRAEVKAHL